MPISLLLLLLATLMLSVELKKRHRTLWGQVGPGGAGGGRRRLVPGSQGAGEGGCSLS